MIDIEISEATKKAIEVNQNRNTCPKCGNTKDHYMLNYSMAWHDGDIHCGKCDAYVRMFDAG